MRQDAKQWLSTLYRCELVTTSATEGDVSRSVSIPIVARDMEPAV
jgi:hypothetical protein